MAANDLGLTRQDLNMNSHSIPDPILERSSKLCQSIWQAGRHQHRAHSTSTNSELIDAILTGKLAADEIHLMTAERQSAGRGQHGRSWQSPVGNAYLSLYYPTQHASDPMTKRLSGVFALMVGYYLSQMPIIQWINQARSTQARPMVGVKWANDLGFYEVADADDHSPNTDNQSAQNNTNGNNTNGDNTNGKNIVALQKLAGVLIEPVIHHGKLLGVVTGVGLNVQQAPTLTPALQEGMSYQAASLQQLLAQAKEDLNGSLADSVADNLADSLASELTDTLADGNLTPDLLYQPMATAIIQAVLTLTTPTAHENFFTGFAAMDILKGKTVQVRQTRHIQQTHTATSNHADAKAKNKPPSSEQLDAEQRVCGQVLGIDVNGCLQILTENGKVESLFTGSIDVLAEALS